MPRMPRWLADFSEKAFKGAYKPVTVTETAYLAPALKRVRYQGDALKATTWKAAQEIEFRVTDTEYRHYTPMCWDIEQGFTDVLFYLHDQGPGSRWAEQLVVGDEVLLIGPGGKFILPPGLSEVIMMGDETTLSAFKGMQDLGSGSSLKCLIECAPENTDWPERIGLHAEVLATIPGHTGKVQEEWLSGQLKSHSQATSYFLSGNANTIKRLRHLLHKSGVPSAQIKVKPYWMEGKAGL